MSTFVYPPQPYPDAPAWEDLESILTNGWTVPGVHQSLQGINDKNTVTVFGRIRIGTSNIIGDLPDHLRAIRPISVQGLILGGPSCLIELQGNDTLGGYRLNMSSFSLGMTNEEMIAAYGGMYLSIAGSYPRKTPAT